MRPASVCTNRMPQHLSLQQPWKKNTMKGRRHQPKFWSQLGFGLRMQSQYLIQPRKLLLRAYRQPVSASSQEPAAHSGGGLYYCQPPLLLKRLVPHKAKHSPAAEEKVGPIGLSDVGCLLLAALGRSGNEGINFHKKSCSTDWSKVPKYRVSGESILGIVIMVLGRDLRFGYLDL